MSSRFQFEVGQRVVDKKHSDLKHYNEYEDDVTRGVVVSLCEDEPHKIRVKWDESYKKPNPENILIEQLIREEEADKILSVLEAEFKVWADPVAEKLKEAGKLIKEADALATKNGRELTEMYDVLGELTSAMEEIGWRTSSLSC